MSTVDTLRQEIEQLSNREVEQKYELYRDLKSKGVRDEIMLTLLEEELYNRVVLV